MEFWKSMYADKSRDFVLGLIEGIRLYAIWENGNQLCGVNRTPFKQIKAEIINQLILNKESKC